MITPGGITPVAGLSIPHQAAAGGGGYDAAVLADAPYGYWKLGEPSGTTATDSSGNAHNGTYGNSPTLGVPGPGSSGRTAVQFTSASGQYVVPSSVFNQGLLTLEAWVKITATPASPQTIVVLQDGLNAPTVGQALYINTDGKLYFFVFDGAAKTTAAPVSVLPLNQWNYVAAVANGTNALAYMNGAQVGTIAAGSTYASYINPNWFIASSASNLAPASTYLNGSLALVAIYPAALSAARISAHYAAV